MMKRTISQMSMNAAIIAGLALGASALVGCSNQTEGQQTLAKAQRMETAGDMIRRGEQLVADGKSTEARGNTVHDQGDHLEGDRLIGEGKADQQKGQELIDQGRHMRDSQ